MRAFSTFLDMTDPLYDREKQDFLDSFDHLYLVNKYQIETKALNTSVIEAKILDFKITEANLPFVANMIGKTEISN